MTPSTIRTGLLLAVLLADAAAQPPAGDKPAPAQGGKLSEWPELKANDQERVMALLAQFRKEPALHAEAHKQLVGIGPCAVPLLFLQLNDQPKNINAPIGAVLDDLTGPTHAALLAREAKKPKVALRRYVMRRLCTFADPEMVPILRAALKDTDEDVVLSASMGLLALKQPDGLELLQKRAQRDWASIRELCAKVLPSGRSMEMGNAILKVISVPKLSPIEVAAGLRLLRSLGPPELTGNVKLFLDAEDTNVKKEAVNALRAMNGEQPLENLSVFQAIEMAKEWKSR